MGMWKHQSHCLDVQAGRQGNSHDEQGGASSDDDAEDGEPAEPRFVIDDEGHANHFPRHHQRFLRGGSACFHSRS